MNIAEAEQRKLDSVARRTFAITADATGNLPTEIELLQVGVWRTPYHGDIMIAPDDLAEYVMNFKNGVAQVAGGAGLPIDFAHNSHLQAAGWIKDIYLSSNGMSLMGAVEWTKDGIEALKGGLYKYFSPEFYPKGRGGWTDPEDYDTQIENVIVGGGLTNIPLFKGLTPVMASANGGGQDKENIIQVFVKASTQERDSMTLEEIRAKELDQLTEEDKTFLTENKDALTVEDRTKFGFEVITKKEEEAIVPEPIIVTAPIVEAPVVAEPVAASAKMPEGVVAVKQEEFDSMKASIATYEKEKVENSVKAHAAKGKIRADQIDVATELILASSTANRAKLESFLDNLPENTAITASEVGNGTDQEVSAAAEVEEKAREAIKASREAGVELSLGDAYSKVMSADTDLRARFNEESK